MNVKKYVCADYIPEDGDAGFLFGNIDSGYGATRRYATYGGKPVIVIAGEMHFSRCERESWERELLKMKAQGLNAVSTYVFWNHHEVKKGVFDFSGNKDITEFLRIVKSTGLKAILRIGPWCHGEVRRGGFPDYLAFVPGKRRTTPVYMRYVKRFWRELAARVKEFNDGETVIGIQIENEYGGNISHIADLRKAADEAGFRTPFYTMTAWPSDTPDKRFLPMFGGYPEAPWTQHKSPLAPCGRFAIVKGRSEVAIGEDLTGKTSSVKGNFEDYPYATCEIGTGNEVTQHRRPIISERDGYGVAFAKLASGANWLGYYMYHGGRNPLADIPMQESRRTLYPNDYPIVDYDFQAPFSKDGAVRGHALRLRLMHYFLADNERSFARTQAFFSEDRTMPYFSYRGDEEGGYVFLSNYERGAVLEDKCADITIDAGRRLKEIHSVPVRAGDMFFFPVNRSYGGITFDYIIAQPIKEIEQNGETHVYFVKYTASVRICRDGEESVVDVPTIETSAKEGKLYLHFLTEEEAMRFYVVGGKVYFSEFPLFERDGETYEERMSDAPAGLVSVVETDPVKLPYSSYMFSSGERRYYKLNVDKSVFGDASDVEITVPFKGLNLQMFKDGKLTDDYFNTDGKFIFRLARIAERDRNSRFILRIAAATACGRGRVYNETNIEAGKVEVSAPEARRIYIKKIIV